MKKLTQEKFIERARKVHGDKYGYDRVVYVNSQKNVEIYCNECKKYFSQTPSNHLQGAGCIKCGMIIGTLKTTYTTEQFITKAIDIHGDKYGYDKVVYVNNHTKVQIYCNTCKEYFNQIPSNHLQGAGCYACGMIKRSKSKTKTTEKFIKEARFVHGDKYGYDKVVYIHNKQNVEIYCKKHKKYFLQKPDNHLYEKGCPICHEFKGEKEVRKFLEKYDIMYDIQKRFSDCRNKNPLPFDFYLPDYNICIEYQGQQHYELINFNGKMTKEQQLMNFNNNKKRDKIKRDYCLKNNIQLIEIPYWDIKKIEEYIVNINTSNTIEVK